MKKSTLIILAVSMIWMNVFGQNKSSNIIPDCEVLTINTMNKLTEKFEKMELDSFDLIINDLIQECGISECTQRLIILKKILSNDSSINAIQTYFENNLQYKFRNRIEDSKEIDFGYIYSVSKVYYGYVPLRHPIDSVVQNISKKLLESDMLSADERLVCVLFSEDVDKFVKLIKGPKYRRSQVRKYLLNKVREEFSRFGAFTIYSGVFRPVSSNDIFTYSPMVGFSISSPLRNKLILELGIKIRFNINDQNLNYYALGEINNVNSDVSIFGGAMVSYKLYESDKLLLLPKLGVGIETIDTGLSEVKKNSADTTYYDVETIHLTLGFSAKTPIYGTNYLGFGINYHYCPYQLDKDLRTEIENNLVSAELSWSF